MNFWDQSLSYLIISLICYTETAGLTGVPILEEKQIDGLWKYVQLLYLVYLEMDGKTPDEKMWCGKLYLAPN